MAAKRRKRHKRRWNFFEPRRRRDAEGGKLTTHFGNQFSHRSTQMDTDPQQRNLDLTTEARRRGGRKTIFPGTLSDLRKNAQIGSKLFCLDAFFKFNLLCPLDDAAPGVGRTPRRLREFGSTEPSMPFRRPYQLESPAKDRI
jgi:hypothetical protein